ncbi:MAG: FAD-dependent oxidoreductase [Gammaproteobacteria bacterium]
MKLILPRGVSQGVFGAALAAFERVLGKEHVLATDTDRETYLDLYAPGNEITHAPSAALVVSSTEQVQEVVRIANQRRIPLWPISRGKNYGYGGSAPAMPGTVVLDLTRMKRILEVNADLGYCIIEPGVGFFDLHEHLTRNRIPLWMEFRATRGGALWATPSSAASAPRRMASTRQVFAAWRSCCRMESWCARARGR